MGRDTYSMPSWLPLLCILLTLSSLYRYRLTPLSRSRTHWLYVHHITGSITRMTHRRRHHSRRQGESSRVVFFIAASAASRWACVVRCAVRRAARRACANIFSLCAHTEPAPALLALASHLPLSSSAAVAVSAVHRSIGRLTDATH